MMSFTNGGSVGLLPLSTLEEAIVKKQDGLELQNLQCFNRCTASVCAEMASTVPPMPKGTTMSEGRA